MVEEAKSRVRFGSEVSWKFFRLYSFIVAFIHAVTLFFLLVHLSTPKLY
jgi:hypothetical protein